MANDVIDTLSIQINAQASQAINNINRLQASLRQLNKVVSQTNGLKINLNGAGGGGGTSGLGRMSALLNASSQAANGFSKAFQKTGSIISKVSKNILGNLGLIRKGAQSASSVADGIKSVIGGLIGFKGISAAFGWVKESISLGADITEIDHIVESVYGDMSSAVMNFSKDAISSFGIAEAASKQYAGVLSAMFQSSGLDYKTAGEMGMNLTALAGDLSAFFNIDTETAFNKIRSGMAGMVRPLRDLGIDMTAATLSAYAMERGITKSYSSMTQSEKIMLRYNYLLSATKTQQGDFARTSESMANASRTLAANFQTLSATIGEGFVAAIRPIIVALNKFMAALIKAAQAFRQFMFTVFGKYKGGASGIAMDMSESDAYADDLADSAGAASDGLGGAADNAKKLKKELAVLPFDELNQLNKDRDTSSSGGSGGGGGGGGGGGDAGIELDEGLFDWTDYLGEDIIEQLGALRDKIQAAFDAHNWVGLGRAVASGINLGLNEIYKVFDEKKIQSKLAPFLNGITVTFNSLVDNINWNKLGSVVGQGINNIVYAFNSIVDRINFRSLGKRLAQGANGMVAQVDFTRIGNLLGAKFMVTWDILYGFVHKFNWAKLGTQLAKQVNSWNIRVDFSKVADALVTGLNGAFTTLFNFTSHVNWAQIGQNIVNGLNTFIHGFDWIGNAEALNNFIQNMLDTLVQIATGTDWRALGEGIAAALARIQWGQILSKVFTVIKEVVGGIWSGLGTTAAGKFVQAIVVFKIGSSLMPFFNNIARAITGSPSTVNVIGNAIGGLFKKAFAALKATTVVKEIGAFFQVIGYSIGNFFSTSFGAALGSIGGSIAGVGVLVGAGFSLWKKEYTKGAEEMSKAVDQLTANMEKSAQTTEQSFEDAQEEITATAQAAKPWLDKLKELEGQSDLTAKEQYEMKAAVEALNDLYPNMGLYIDEVTGSLNMSTSAVEEFIEASKKQAQAQAYFEAAKSYYKDAANSLTTLTDAQDAQSRAIEKREALERQLQILSGELTGTEEERAQVLSKVTSLQDAGLTADAARASVVDELQQSLKYATIAEEECNDAVAQAQEVYDGATAKGDELIGKYSELSNEADTLTDAIENEIAAINEGNATWEGMEEILKRLHAQGQLNDEQFEYMNGVLEAQHDRTDDATDAWGYFRDELENVGSTHDRVMSEIEQKQEEAKQIQDEYTESVKAALQRSSKYFEMYDETAEDIFEKIKNGGEVSVEEWMADIDKQIEAMHSWEQDIQKLTEMGLEEGYLQQLRDAGPEGADITNYLVNLSAEEFGQLNDKFKEKADVIGLTDDVGQDLTQGMKEAAEKAAGVAGDGGEDTAKAYGEGYAKGSSTAERAVKTATENTVRKGVLQATDDLLKINSPSKVAEEKGKYYDQGLAQGLTGNTTIITNATKIVIDKIVSPFKDIDKQFTTFGKNIGTALTTALSSAQGQLQGVGTNLEKALTSSLSSAQNTIQNIGVNFAKALTSSLSSAQSTMYNTGGGLATNLANGLRYGAGSINSTISSIASGIYSGFSINLYNQGLSAGQSFANGIRAIRVPIPHISKSGSSTVSVGDTRVQIPYFSVKWYRQGGLFKGGQGQVIGVGEGGRDEAVLPLENTQVMARIADAIVSASDGFGMDATAMANAVANGVAMAASTGSFGDSDREIVIQIDSEAIARASMRGQKRLDARYNPVASTSY